MKKILTLGLCLCLLYGCQNNEEAKVDTQEQTQEEKRLFEGLDAKQTYEAAVKQMNESLDYYVAKEESDYTRKYEYYNKNDYIAVVLKELYQDSDFSSVNFTITNGNEFYTLYPNADDTYSYSYADDYSGQKESMYVNVYEDKNAEVKSIERKDQENVIILDMRLEVSTIQQQSDTNEHVSYIQNQIKINSEGYIVEENKTYYDKDFENEVDKAVHIEYSDFNKKGQDELENEISLMKECEGLGYQDIVSKLGLS